MSNNTLYNNIDIKKWYYNNTDLDKVYYNNTLVFQKQQGISYDMELGTIVDITIKDTTHNKLYVPDSSGTYKFILVSKYDNSEFISSDKTYTFQFLCMQSVATTTWPKAIKYRWDCTVKDNNLKNQTSTNNNISSLWQLGPGLINAFGKDKAKEIRNLGVDYWTASLCSNTQGGSDTEDDYTYSDEDQNMAFIVNKNGNCDNFSKSGNNFDVVSSYMYYDHVNKNHGVVPRLMISIPK